MVAILHSVMQRRSAALGSQDIRIFIKGLVESGSIDINFGASSKRELHGFQVAMLSRPQESLEPGMVFRDISLV